MKKLALQCTNEIRFQASTAEALQEAAEAMLVNWFESSKVNSMIISHNLTV
jgi:histone H3/H4